MLSIGLIGMPQERYYTELSREDYYTQAASPLVSGTDLARGIWTCEGRSTRSTSPRCSVGLIQAAKESWSGMPGATNGGLRSI